MKLLETKKQMVRNHHAMEALRAQLEQPASIADQIANAREMLRLTREQSVVFRRLDAPAGVKAELEAQARFVEASIRMLEVSQ